VLIACLRHNVEYCDFGPGAETDLRCGERLDSDSAIDVEYRAADGVHSGLVFFTELGECDNCAVERQGDLSSVGVAAEVEIEVEVSNGLDQVGIVIEKYAEIIFWDGAKKSLKCGWIVAAQAGDVYGLPVLGDGDGFCVQQFEACAGVQIEVIPGVGLEFAVNGELCEGGLKILECLFEERQGAGGVEGIAGEDDDVRL